MQVQDHPVKNSCSEDVIIARKIRAFHELWPKENTRDVSKSHWFLLRILDVQNALFPLEGVSTCINLSKAIHCDKGYKDLVYGINKAPSKT